MVHDTWCGPVQLSECQIHTEGALFQDSAMLGPSPFPSFTVDQGVLLSLCASQLQAAANSLLSSLTDLKESAPDDADLLDALLYSQTDQGLTHVSRHMHGCSSPAYISCVFLEHDAC